MATGPMGAFNTRRADRLNISWVSVGRTVLTSDNTS